MNNDESFDKFFEKINEQFLKLDSILYKGCRDINTKWKLKIEEIDKSQLYFEATKNQVNEFKTILSRKKKKMIIFGETSSGKSTFINALLKRNLLKMGLGKITQCITKIQQCTDVEKCIIVNGQAKSTDVVQDIKTLTGPISNSTKFLENVFIDFKKTDFPLEDLEIVDTPGINTDKEIDDIVQKECKDADVIILILSCTSIINMTIKEFCKTLKNVFTNKKVFIIINRSEEFDNDEDAKKNFYNDAEKLLTEIFKYTTEQIRNKIFFISAKEQLNSGSNVSSDFMNEAMIKRKDKFKSMENYLKKEFEMSIFQRKCTNLYDFFSKVKTSFSKVKVEIQNICHNIHFRRINHENIYNLLNTSEYKDGIEKIISDLYGIYYDKFIKESIKISDGDKITHELEEVFKKTCDAFKQNIENKVKALIQSDNEENLKDKLYFMENFYFELINKRFEGLKSPFEKDFVKINKKIKISKGLTIGGVTLLGVAGAATGGLAIGIFAAVEVGIGAALGVAAGTAATVGATTGILEKIKDPFRIIWKKEEKPINDHWEKFKNDLTRVFNEFLEDLLNASRSIEALKEQMISIENEMEKIENEIKSFQLECIIY